MKREEFEIAETVRALQHKVEDIVCETYVRDLDHDRSFDLLLNVSEAQDLIDELGGIYKASRAMDNYHKYLSNLIEYRCNNHMKYDLMEQCAAYTVAAEFVAGVYDDVDDDNDDDEEEDEYDD